jgi:hypothetical protein
MAKPQKLVTIRSGEKFYTIIEAEEYIKKHKTKDKTIYVIPSGV